MAINENIVVEHLNNKLNKLYEVGFQGISPKPDDAIIASSFDRLILYIGGKYQESTVQIVLKGEAPHSGWVIGVRQPI